MKSLVIAAACMTAACGGAQHPTEPAASGAGATFPVTTVIPAHPTYLVVLARVDRAAGLMRDLVRPLAAIEANLRPDAIDRELRRSLAGVSPLSAADLADAGFAFDRNLALYSTTVAPTLVVPVADQAKVTAWLEKLTHDVTISVGDHRGVQVSAFSDGGERLSYAFHRGWLFVHLGKSSAPPFAWLDEILDARSTAAGDADVAWALGRAGSRKDGIGLVRWPALVEAAAPTGGNVRECKEINDWAAHRFGRIALHGAFDGRGKLDGRIDVELAPASLAAVRAAVTPPPDARFQALRADAAVWLAWAWNPRMSQREDVPARPEGHGCALGGGLAELWMALLEAGHQLPLTGVRVAVLGAKDNGADVDLTAAAWLTPTSGPLVLAALKQISSLPNVTHPLVTDSRLPDAILLTVGRDVRDRVTSGPAAKIDPTPPELFAFELQPDRIPDVKPIFDLLYRDVFRNDWLFEGIAKKLAIFFAQYHSLSLRVTVEDFGIRVAGGFELR